MIHTPSHCPKCGKTFFEVTELMNLEHARYDADAIRCTRPQRLLRVSSIAPLTRSDCGSGPSCVSPLSDRAIEPTARTTKGRMRIPARQIPAAAQGGNQ